MQRNEYVLKNMFGSFFLATVLTALMAQLGSIADSIVIGHLVSPDALSVVRIWQPVENFMYIMIGMMSAGACFLSARGIGAQDYYKVNRVFNHHLYYVIVSALLVIALLLPFADEVAGMITTNGRLQPMLRPYIHAEFFAVFVAIYTPELIWYILPVTAWLLLLVMVAMAYVVHRRNPLLSWPTLQNTVPSNPAVTFSLPYTIEGVREFLAKVKPFVKACELDSGIAARVAIEELVYEIVETNADRRPNETFDVRITDKETIFTIVLKSKGPLRNPIYKYSDDKLIHINGSNMRLAILSRVCKHINHKYMNGVNCIYLNFYRA